MPSLEERLAQLNDANKKESEFFKEINEVALKYAESVRGKTGCDMHDFHYYLGEHLMKKSEGVES